MDQRQCDSETRNLDEKKKIFKGPSVLVLKP